MDASENMSAQTAIQFIGGVIHCACDHGLRRWFDTVLCIKSALSEFKQLHQAGSTRRHILDPLTRAPSALPYHSDCLPLVLTPVANGKA